jgi:uncharacterized glyoxalase superfamily protein PhnB
VSVYPVVRYKDPAAGIEWLKRAFGLSEQTVDTGDDGTVRHAELRAGDGLVMISPAREDDWMGGTSPDPLRSTVSVYIVLDGDIDAHHDRAKAAGATIVMRPTDHDYGSRDYSARDPEGNLWSFGTYSPTASGH